MINDKTVLTIVLSSIYKRVDVPLVAKFYSLEEVRETIKDVANCIDHTVFEHLQKLENRIQSLEADLEMANDKIKFLENESE